MPHWTNRTQLVAALVVLAAWTSAVPAAQDGAAAPSFLWKVQRGERALYLAGSVHAMTPDAYPLSAALERAFEEADTLVEEIDLAEADPSGAGPMLLARGLYADGRRFESALSPETASIVAARMTSAGVPPQLFQSMKPWMIMLTLTAIEAQRAGLDTSLGLDRHFFERARAAGKAIVGLETAASQLDRLDRMPEPVQEQMLRATLNDIDTARESLQAIVAAWKRGDADAVAVSLLEAFDGYPDAYRSLIVERNQSWLP